MPRHAARFRRRAAVLLVVLGAAACSPAQIKNASGPNAGLVQESGSPSATPGAPGTSGAPTAGATGKPGGKGAGTGRGGSGSVAGPTLRPGGTAQPLPPVDAPGDLQFYDGALNTRGITNEKIVLCAHAALTYADAFQTKPEDFNVFWTDLNSKGGINGRNVEMTYEDDAYDSVQAITAATRCAGKNPFAILGGIGFDQIPGVRRWAEEQGSRASLDA